MQIENYNCHKECADICMEQYCDNLATDFIKQDIGGIIFLIPTCEEHYQKMVNALIKKHETTQTTFGGNKK